MPFFDPIAYVPHKMDNFLHNITYSITKTHFLAVIANSKNIKTYAKGGFFSERADAFVISPNRRT